MRLCVFCHCLDFWCKSMFIYMSINYWRYSKAELPVIQQKISNFKDTGYTWQISRHFYKENNFYDFFFSCRLKKKIREKSRECHNHKPQPSSETSSEKRSTRKGNKLFPKEAFFYSKLLSEGSISNFDRVVSLESAPISLHLVISFTSNDQLYLII